MKKIRIYDGCSVVTTNYYGSMPKRKDNEADEEYYKRFLQTSKGVFTNGIVITLRNLFADIIRERPDYVAFVFDKTRNTFRKELYNDYKGNRSKTPDPLIQQVQNIQKILTAIGIPVFASNKYEADDLACSITKQFKDIPDVHIDIVTKDHDYYQLVDKNVTIWQPQSHNKVKEWYISHGYNSEEIKTLPTNMIPINVDDVFDEIGVEPYQVPDLKGLVGDTSDNIPGVKNVSSAAAPLLCMYETVEGVYEALEQDTDIFLATCKALGIKRSPVNALKKGKDSAFLSKKLATMVDVNIDPDIAKYLPADLEELKLNLDEQALNDVVKEYELNSLWAFLKALSDYKLSHNISNGKNILNLIVLQNNKSNKDLNNLYMTIRKLTVNRKSKIFCDSEIGSLDVCHTSGFADASGDKALLFVIHKNNGSSDCTISQFKTIVSWAKNLNCQIRIAMVDEQKNNEIKIFLPETILAILEKADISENKAS